MEIEQLNLEEVLKKAEDFKNALFFQRFCEIEDVLIDKDEQGKALLKALKESEKERDLLVKDLNKVENDNIDLKSKVKELEAEKKTIENIMLSYKNYHLENVDLRAKVKALESDFYDINELLQKERYQYINQAHVNKELNLETLLQCLRLTHDKDLISKEQRDHWINKKMIVTYCGFNIISYLGLTVLIERGILKGETND